MKRSSIIIVLSAVAGLVVACSGSSPATDTDRPPKGETPGGGTSGSNGGDGDGNKPEPGPGEECPPKSANIDVTAFPACMEVGRCVPDSFFIGHEADKERLNKCEDGQSYCVPEIFLATGGQYVPKSCASLSGAEGRCISTIFKDVEAQKNELPQDVCAKNERCGPCFDPTNGQETGLCSLTKCDKPAKPKVVFGNCCMKNGKAGGRCIPKTLVPEKDREGLETKECKKNEELCAPAEQLDPTYVPPKCKAEIFIGDYDGVCISDCINKDFWTEIGTDKGNCKADSFCAPCKNPFNGEPTGAPGCDP